MLNLRNPIPRSVDDEKLFKFIRKYGIIPYYGSTDETSHKFLDLQMSLTSLSPSYVACMSDLTSYTFGQNISIVGRTIPGLSDEPVDLERSAKENYLNFLADLNISLLGVIARLKKVLRYDKDNGNAYIHLKRVTVGGSTKYFIKTPHYKHVAYLESKDPGLEFIIISKHLMKPDAEQLLKKYPPTILRATRYGEDLSLKWDPTGDGVEEAVLHIANDEHNDEADVYGRPKTNSVLSWLYTDFEIGNLNAKISTSEVVSKKILAFQAPDPRTLPIDTDKEGTAVELNAAGKIGGKVKKEDYFQRNLRVLREITTNLGTTETVAGFGAIEYPYGDKPPETIDLELNRDTKHHQWQLETASSEICGALQWAAELTNIRQAKANIGGNMYYDLFTTKNTTTIKPLQVWLENIYNFVLSQICEKEGADQEFKNYGIQFPDTISDMIKEFKGDPQIMNPLNQVQPTEPDPEEDD